MPINRTSLAKTSGVLGLRLLAPPNPFVATPTLVRPVRRKFKAAQSPGTGTIREERTHAGCVDFCVAYRTWAVLVEVPISPSPTQKFAASFLLIFLNILLKNISVYISPFPFIKDGLKTKGAVSQCNTCILPQPFNN